MTSRERLTSGRVADPPRTPAGGSPTPDHAEPCPELPRTALWEAIFQSCSAPEQRELLALAGHQGLLYGHQLPPRNGTASGEPHNPVLSHLLHGHVQHLEPVRPTPVPPRDATLDTGQRDAVAKALATPDICLVQGLPGTGKSRVVAEILVQAAGRGERVLLLAPSAVAVDRILELLPPGDDVYALRLLGPGERAESLSPASRKLTLPERLQELQRQAADQGREALTSREQQHRRLGQDEPLWHRLQEMAERLDQLHRQIEALSQALPQLADELRQEAQAVVGGREAADSFQTALAAAFGQFQEVQTQVDKALLELRERIEKLRQDHNQITAQLDSLRPLVDAQRDGRWWTGLWWRALFRKGLADEVASLEARRQQAQKDLGDLDQEVQLLDQQCGQARQAFETEERRHSDKELARRQAEVDNQVAAFRHEAKLLHAKWQETVAALRPDSPRPAAPTAAGLRDAADARRQQLHREEQECLLLRQWLACLEETSSWPARVHNYANVVAATTAALAADDHFGKRAGTTPSFDRLVLQDADQVTEVEFMAHVRHARRWVFIGAPALDRGRTVERNSGLRKVRSPSARPAFFDSLWHHLHWEPRSLPYAWIQEGERLCCQLRPVATDQRQWIETESVADFPDIELRILALPRTQPVLAEVVFPPTLSIQEAKKYVYQEVGELAVEPPGQNVDWVEEADRLVLRLADDAVTQAVRVPLDSGVCELVGSLAVERNGSAGTAKAAHWPTCCLEFDCTAGWDRGRAEEWIQEHLGVRDLGRTACLTVPHRMHPHLAAVLSHILFGGDYQTRPADDDRPAPPRVVFVPVPPLRERNELTKGKDGHPSPGGVATLTLPRKGGAGLEIDLADPRQRTRLPANLGVELPNRGFVNCPEAQAVMRTLEAMAAQPAGWPALGGEATGSSRPLVAVLALYPAQVELLRSLVRQSPPLAAANFAVVVEGPAALREQEVAMVLLSLTRSHAHRPITFGEGPELLTLALTRARSQLVLFGDPGSLSRRSQWEGPLDHLDEAAAACEREMISQLVQYLQGQGPHPHAFQLREGAGT